MTMANTFSEREMEIMAKAWQCMSEKPKIDYEKLGGLCNFTNPRSASNAWSNIKKKLDALGQGDDAAEGTPNPKTSKSATKKRASTAKGDDESPTKKARGKRASKAKADDSDGEKVEVKGEPIDNDDDDF